MSSSRLLASALVLAAALFVGVIDSPTPSAAAGPPAANWVVQSPAASPPALQAASLAFDPAIGRMVLFGGYDGFSLLAGTWTYDGTTWAQQSPATSPPARELPAMAYDLATGKMVLFGGFAGTSRLADTWTYDGTTWAQQSPAAHPSARSGATMAFDSATGRMVLFGGISDSGYLADTWTYDGTTWAQQAPATSPPVRMHGAMAFDPAVGRMVLFGGYGAGSYLADTWTYDGTTWAQQAPATSPPGRYGSTMDFDLATGTMVLFGGGGPSSYLADTWTYDGTSWTQQSPGTSPPARGYASMAFDPVTGQVVLFGGYSDGAFLGDTWTFGYSTRIGHNWAQQSPATSPSGRTGAAMAFDPATGKTVLFGGYSDVGGDLADTWTYDGTTWAQQSPATSPPSRDGAMMAFDPAIGRIVLFGGYRISGSTETYLSDTWTYDGATWTKQLPATSPPARYYASMAFDPAIGRIVLFGGWSPGVPPPYYRWGDTWTYDGTTWSQQTPTSSPTPRAYAGMTFDPAIGRIVLFGGDGGPSGYLADTWTYDGTTWTQQSPATSPIARAFPALAFDPAEGRLVLFGGDNGDYFLDPWLADTWTYDGTTWTQQSPATSPAARSVASMDFDAATGQVLLFGGYGDWSRLGDTWAWRGVSIKPAAPTGVTGTPGHGSVTVSWTAPDDGGSPITGYVVTPYIGALAQTPQPFNSPATTETVTGLADGTAYTFTVTATNAVGTGPESPPSPVVMTWAVPGVPAGVSASMGNAKVTFSWSAPASDGGTPVIGYRIYRSTSAGAEAQLAMVGASATSYVDTAVTVGSRYYFKVAAENVVDIGPQSIEVSAVAGGSPAITTVASRSFSLGFAGSFQLRAKGYPAPSFSLARGGLPLGVMLSSKGLLSGTPTVPGRFTVTVTARNSFGSASQVFTLSVVPPKPGYWLATASGSVFAAGAAPSLGGTSVPSTNRAVSVAPTLTGRGYWLVTRTGSVFAFGDARGYGSLPARGIRVTDVVAIVPTWDSRGYWVVRADGEVYPFGDAKFRGDLMHLPGGGHLHVTNIVGMVAAPNATGYLMIGSDGGVFAFGSVHYYGSLPGLGIHVANIRGILPAPTYTGYILVGSDGGAFVFGHGAPYKGSLPGRGVRVSNVVGIALTPDGQGYWMAGSSGSVYAFGNAPAFAPPPAVTARLPVVSIAGT